MAIQQSFDFVKNDQSNLNCMDRKETRMEKVKGFIKRHWASFVVGIGVGVGGTFVAQTLMEKQSDEEVQEPETVESFPQF